ncbi:MAG: formylmethanofuran dehydrogenase subunit B [Planctomycetes bacterium]|nr:formylmethanofuran dehydrogenase subunit B [Planctomycetota bacterium]
MPSAKTAIGSSTTTPAAGNGQPADAPQVVDVPCTGCGCVCDDLTIGTRDGAIVELSVNCDLAREWFGNAVTAARDATPVQINGRPATLETALAEAAKLLSNATSPLIYGLSETNCEAQRQAVALADELGAVLDTPTSHQHGPTGMALNAVGEVTCSLGEVRHRGDVIVFWRCDPAISHPRYFERYSLDAPGEFLPGGRRNRYCIVIGAERTATAERADEFIALAEGRDFEALWTLRALVRGLPLDAATVLRQTGVALDVWRTLAERLKQASFGVLVFDEELPAGPGRELNIEAIEALACDLNAHTRAVCTPLRAAAGSAGADDVILWQTGYPFAVNLARGFPRYNGREFSAVELVERGEVDVVLVVAADPLADWPERARQALAKLPVICIDSRDTATRREARIALATAPYGVSVGGTVHRMDEVPLPLRPVLSSELLSDEEILTRLTALIRRGG